MSQERKTVKATVGAVVEKEGKILLQLRNHAPFYDHWCIPGGHIEFGEAVEDAIVREVKEETGLDVEKLTFFCYYNEYYENLDWHAVALVFIARASGELKLQEAEVKELRWCTPEEALELPMAFEHGKVLKDFVEAG